MYIVNPANLLNSHQTLLISNTIWKGQCNTFESVIITPYIVNPANLLNYQQRLELHSLHNQNYINFLWHNCQNSALIISTSIQIDIILCIIFFLEGMLDLVDSFTNQWCYFNVVNHFKGANKNKNRPTLHVINSK